MIRKIQWGMMEVIFRQEQDGIVSHLKYLLSIEARKWVFTLKEFI